MSKHKRYVQEKKSMDINNSVDTSATQGLSEQQVYDVLSFAREAYSYAYGGKVNYESYNGAYTPYLTNERLSEIGLNPQKVSKEQLDKILEDPIDGQYNLIGYSEFLKFTDTIAKRTLGYMGNLPAFDLKPRCINIKNPEEYNSPEYLADKAIVKEFLSKFDYKGQFASVNRRTFEIDAYYGILRYDGERYAFQELPYNYCKITGKTPSWGFQFDFDMSWFLKMGLSIDSYPPIFKKMWRRVMKGKNMKDYDPSNPLKDRKGTFSLWAQTSSLPDKGNFVCFKMNSDMYATMPYLTPMFQDSINKPLIRALQLDQDIIASQKILIGLIPLLKDQKSGQIKDALAVSPETMGRFLGLLKQGLSRAVKITGAPFEDVKQVEFNPPTTNMYNQANGIEAANSGVTSRIIYSSDKMTATEVEYSIGIDSMIAKSVYPQYETWLASMVNTLTKKYKFAFTFKGTKFKDDRKDRLENSLKLADKGMVDFAEIACAIGEDVYTFEDSITESAYSPIWNKLKLLMNTNTSSGSSSSSSGRPMTDNPSDSTDRKDDRLKEE